MGGSLSIDHHRPAGSFYVQHTESYKRLKTTSSSHFWDEKPLLLPGLPDEISHQIVARIPRIWYLNLKAVSRSWKAAVTRPEIYKIRKELGTTEEWLYILMYHMRGGLFWHALDPISKMWQRLPPIPNGFVGSSTRNVDDMRERFGRKACNGCAIAAVDGCLYMLGGVSRYSSLTVVWKYDPVSNCWSEANPMSVGRANFEAGVLNNKLFVVGGESFSHHGGVNFTKTPLQSAEVFDPKTGLWSDIATMPCSKAHSIAAAFIADVNTPVAIGLASYRGKLYVPQSFYQLPFFADVDVGGEVYDPETNSWVDMPTGMGEGWPAQLWGTKPTVVVDGDLYALEPVYSLGGALEGARVNVYNHHDDSWKVVEGDVPLRAHSPYILTALRGQSPFMLTGLLGKLHVVTVDDNGNIVVMRADKLDDSIASSGEGTSESNMWSVIATGNIRFGRLERFGRLDGCQTLDI